MTIDQKQQLRQLLLHNRTTAEVEKLCALLLLEQQEEIEKAVSKVKCTPKIMYKNFKPYTFLTGVVLGVSAALITLSVLKFIL